MAVRPPRLLALCVMAATPSAHAGQPLVTDDAAVVAPKTCQLETWAHWVHDAREYWAQPACNFTGNLELAIGGARTYPDTGESSSIVQLQAKTVLFPRGDGTLSFGAVVGGARDTGVPHGHSPFQSYNARALMSWYPRSDLEIDLNLGAANVYGSGTFALAGAALQYGVTEKMQLLAEVFRDEPGPAKYQVGARYVVVPDRFEAYASYGKPFGGSASPWSVIIGIRIQTPPVFP
jgi:hypothetical protein